MDFKEDLIQVAIKLGKVPTIREYLRYGNYSKRYIYSNFGSWGDAISEVFFNSDVEFIDKKTEDVSLWELFDICDENKKVFDKSNNIQYKATVNIKTNKPILISMAACFHLGSQFTNYKELKEAISKIINTDNLYIGICGDIIDNFLYSFPSKDAINSEVLPPDMQLILLKKLVEEYERNKKLLFKVLGNHEKFYSRLTGNKIWDILIGGNSPFLPYGGKVTINVGKQSYIFYVKHKARFSSSLNPFHQPYKLYKELFNDADVIVISDQHKPAIANTFVGGKEIGFIRTGTFKLSDPYSLEFEFKNFDKPKGKVEIPTILLYNDIKKFVLFNSIEDALVYYKGLNCQ